MLEDFGNLKIKISDKQHISLESYPYLMENIKTLIEANYIKKAEVIKAIGEQSYRRASNRRT